MIPSIEIVIVGNEILHGRTLDCNAPFFVNSLAEAGYRVRFVSNVGDNAGDIAGTLRNASKRADIVLVTGGLGPTSDDVTVEGAAEAFGLELVLDEETADYIRAFFSSRRREMSETNLKQAYIPQGARVIKNNHGTAPGIFLEIGAGFEDAANNSRIYLMPGVPSEAREMFHKSILPEISANYTPVKLQTSVLKVIGINESDLYEKIRDIPGAKEAFSFYPSIRGIELRIVTDEDSPMSAEELNKWVSGILKEKVIQEEEFSLEGAVGKLLKEKNLTLGTAESCSGGLIASRITDIPGSSEYFLFGTVAYSNESKVSVLGVSPELIKRYGAVSEEVSSAMAEGVRKVSGVDIGISTTGIAGPGGGSPEKPVGLVYISLASASGTTTKKLQFGENRIINKERTAQEALNMLRLFLLGV